MKSNSDYIGTLAGYIKKNLKKGYTKDSLKWALISQGHSKIEIEKALKRVDLELSREAPVLNTKPAIKSEIINFKRLPFEEQKSWWKKIFD